MEVNSKKQTKKRPALQPVDWCINRLEVALMDYNVEDMRNYLVALKMWRKREVGNA